MSLVTKEAPDFVAKAVLADGTIDESFRLSDLRGRYVYLLFYPLDFTFVCPTELLAFDERIEDFRERNCQVVGVSVDSEYTHLTWRNTPVEHGGIGALAYPLVSDLTKQIARDYGVLVENAGVALRGLFLIDRDGVVRHELVNDLDIGRSVDEAIRILDALQFAEQHGQVCPANWKPGEDAMEATPEGVARYLKEHVASA